MKKILLVCMLLLVVTGCSGSKLVCKSDEGDITLYYDDNGITGYSADGITYDMEEQNEVFDHIGKDTYLSDFNNWFISATTGECTSVID